MLTFKLQASSFTISIPSSPGPENSTTLLQPKSQIPMDNHIHHSTRRSSSLHTQKKKIQVLVPCPPKNGGMLGKVDPRNVQVTRGWGITRSRTVGLASDSFGKLHRSRYGTSIQGSSATSTALKLSGTSLRAALFAEPVFKFVGSEECHTDQPVHSPRLVPECANR